MKRLFDMAASAAGLLVFALPILALVLMIRRDTPGPGLFAQVRIGRHGRPFTCYKLRTMRADTASLPSHETPRAAVTTLGNRLRRTKLDELPQLWNVLRGDMSLVGPRPCLPQQTVLVEARRARGVLAVRPGITGLAQVRGIDMSDPLRLAAVDADYVRRRSMRLDLVLLLRTVIGGGRGDRTLT
ncbi:sugar transferase [Mangrovibrevibacter kandeliae]|uniref:sugar transferase n=1 Tax=Mangrovibrevibacter kandeliae TaxID=2968473 RepID=UPI0021199C08|nr:sugar transferase [Aurantimonas sp. CSK15Z-1]MCQ8784044.1 sugar transferase [Aurantimonas sp. CSK15Z-1]